MITAIIRKLSAPAEFCLIVFVCSWWAITLSVVEIAKQTRNTPTSSQTQSAFAGIGVALGAKQNKLVIQQVLPNTPAAVAGLSRGLILQKINGTNTDGMTPDACRELIRGPVGSKVKLELIDPAESKTNIVELARGTIQGSPKPTATNASALAVAGLELFGLAVMFWIARVRNWPLGAWGFRPSWKLTGAGILLWLAVTLVIAGIGALANFISPGMVHKHSVSDLSLPVLILFAIINAVFEETLESGYFIQSLQRYGIWSAVLASAFFRAFLHAYHGVAALIVIFPLGLLFGFIYRKWRRLWPLFVAHVLLDLVAYFHG
jgi:membrane protease YdiL (CAAX protease family)